MSCSEFPVGDSIQNGFADHRFVEGRYVTDEEAILVTESLVTKI